MNQIGLTLLTRADCHLCEEVTEMLNRLGVAFATIDVDTDVSLSGRYGDAVPVLLSGDREIGRAPFSEQELKAALKRAE